MKLTKQLEKEVMQVYEAYWNSLLNADMKIYTSVVDTGFRLIGTTEAEVFYNRKDAIRFFKATAEQVAGNIDIRNRSIKTESFDGLVLITEMSDVYVQAEGKWVFYSRMRGSTFMQKMKEGWKLVQKHISFPDTKAQEGETIGLKKISKENQELREAVKRRTTELEQKNRELEIETALEKVRAVALGMRKPEDLPVICEILFLELNTLGFTEIRNAMINIHDDEKETFVNYDYSDEIGKSINHLSYNIHPLIEKQIKQIRSAGDAFSETSFKGKDLKDWKAFRKKIGEKDDPRIENTKALYYYFYSIGTGSIGISTFSSIAEEKLNVLKRFRNVFDFAYRRYMDVAQAEAQAREAQIEASLERVRSRTMAMQHSDELQEVSTLLFKQVQSFGVEAWSCGFNVWENDGKDLASWMCKEDGTVNPPFKVPIKENPRYIHSYEAWRKGEPFYWDELHGEDMEAFYRYLRSIPIINYVLESNAKAGFILPASQVHHVANFSHGYLMFITYKPCPEVHDIFKRFAAVFEQTYTRFLDLQKAEAQARESQIQLAMERVRARTMAMQHSEELTEVANLLFRQVESLGVPMWGCGFNIWEPGERSCTAWLSSAGMLQPPVTIPLTEDPTFIRLYESRQKGELFYAEELGGDALTDHYRYLMGIPDFRKMYANYIEAGFKAPTFQVNNVVYFSHGNLIFISPEQVPKAWDVFKRFAKVFEQTYTRFLDLQKAETQAREAQIEAALERVRSKTMAMHNSQDIGITVAAMFDELLKLGVDKTIRCGIGILDDTTHMEVWTASSSPDGKVVLNIGKLDMTMHPLLSGVTNAWKNKEQGFSYELAGKDLIDYYTVINNSPDYHFHVDIKSLPAKIIHNDFFFPDGSLFAFTHEPIPAETSLIFKRFAAVFGQTYRRFLDLQKAEVQAREAQIELGLERVRARAMAMQNSDELKDLIGTVFIELTKLDLVLTRCLIMIYDPQSNASTWWMANSEAPSDPIGLYIKNHQLPPYAAYIKAWKEQKNKWQYILEGEDKEDWDDFLFTETELSQLPDFIIAGMKAPDRVCLSASFNNFGCLNLATLEPLSVEHFDILLRFAKVFDLTYTRFNDLQKAEAQTREAKIEAALEKVRSRTMAMQRSDELSETATVLFEQLKQLGEEPERTFIGVVNEEEHVIEIWATQHGGIQMNMILKATIDEPMVMNRMYSGWKEQKKSIVIDLRGEELESYFQFLKGMGAPVKREIFGERRLENIAFFSKGMLGIITPDPRTPEAIQLYERFAGVFDLTYTRFLDLKKAEAQAREARIEAALERVRSKTMAMHNSQEVGETVATLFDQLVKLGVTTNRCGILIFSNTNDTEVWTAKSNLGGEAALIIGHLDVTIHPMLQGVRNAWKNKESFFSYEMSGGDLTDYYNAINNFPGYPVRFNMDSLPSNEIHSDFFFPEGAVFAFTSAPIEAGTALLFKRFAGVFGQTYRRYLDLQKAEAQAREATIEAALEKVRGKAMAMHNSNDLSVTASMVFTELRKLGIKPIRCGVGLLNKESRKGQLYSATSSADGDSLSLVGWVMLSGHPVLQNIYDTWLKNEEYYPELGGEQLKSYYELLLAGLSVTVPDWQSGQKQYGTFLPFSVGCLYAWSENPYNEAEIKILKRFATIIDLTFRRYIELQKSEANAREAVKQAALDRIRADIASMRTISDLERITPLIWKELTILGVPFIRCGVFIMDESQEFIHTFLSTPDGKAIAAFHLPYTTPGNIARVLSHWQDKKNYIEHWDEAAFTEFAHTLVKQGALASPEQYLKTLPRGGFYLHFLPFLQGMLYVGNTTQLGEEEIKLIQSVADAFSTAYARYEDFNKLETAKQQVEKTLVDLKQTQAQLVQSEKMASLGELTAGIAHEIQNPLNFVNNFSEVSNELLDEMIAELDNDNKEDAIAIAGDVKQNLEKILHHGKRADGIVKGMLQHSRSSSATKEPTDINKLADEYLRLAYHGLRAKDKSFNATLKTDYDETIGNINIIPQDIGRAVLNLITNAFYAAPLPPEGGFSDPDYVHSPTVWVSTKKINNNVLISVRDNGPGIPKKILDKIFQPFFTTKPTGQGTGLGLSLSYDIVKSHGGEIKVETKENEGTEFIIQVPIV